MHDVAVGENETSRCENETRSTACNFAWGGTSLTVTTGMPSYLYINKRGTPSLGGFYNRARISIEQTLVGGLRGLHACARFNQLSFIISCNCVLHLYLLINQLIHPQITQIFLVCESVNP